MEVLLWLVPAATATVLAMAWATWTGRRMRRDAERDRRTAPRDDAQARARLGAALARPVPTRARTVVAPAVDRGTGVALRRRPVGADESPARDSAVRR